ncbi:MAG TPA: hypothetical protein VGQ44_06435 [Gemmatimonadaceae bacterium]|nr:hypothetical protein [Gemmatimonadaceae bacterium]
MKNRRAGTSSVVLLALSVAITIVAACGGNPPRSADASHNPGAPADSYRYTAPPAVRTYPSPNATIQSWIAANNDVAIRAHGWDIWQSITTATRFNQMPVWQTWFSGYEIFEETTQTTLFARSKRGVVQFGARRDVPRLAPVPRGRMDNLPYVHAERVFAFNRFTLSTASFIYENKLNKAQTLSDTNVAFEKRRTPTASRAILTSPDSTDRMSFVLKPVYQFISGTEVTAVPYWFGDSSRATTDSANPIASTWRQAVAVDPTGKLQPGDSVWLPVNNEGYKKCLVVPLSAFYWIRITKEDSIAFTQFGAANGDFIGVANDTSFQAVIQAVRPGNIGLLMAMHVTGKEIPNWTWQSYWWSINPQDPHFGRDRPSTIPAPWNHYNMTVAYYMMRNNGAQNIAYNPYLESSLSGYLPKPGGKPTDSVFWTGVTTNCMSCHRRASVGFYMDPKGDTVAATGAPYGNDMNVSAGDTVVFTQPVSGLPYRMPVLKTDFLWSVAIRWGGKVVIRSDRAKTP